MLRRLIPLLLLGAMTPAVAARAQDHATASTFAPRVVDLPSGRVDVPLRIVQDVRATVQVMVNGKGPFTFGIETGAPFTVVGPRVVAAAGVVDGGMRASVDSLRIGDAVFRDLPVQRGPELVPGIDGLLGLPAYSQILITVDYPRERVVFERGTLPEPDGRDVFPAMRIGPFVGVTIDVDGTAMDAVIDTQSALSLSLPPSLASNVHLAMPMVTVGRAGVGTAAPVDLRAARMAGSAHIGRYALQQPVVYALQVPPGYPGGALLGARLLREFAITIDQRSMRVRFQRSDAVIPRSGPVRTIGLSLTTASNGDVTVSTADEWGTAAKAGLRAGDVLTSVGGRPAREYAGPGQLTTLVNRGDVIRFEVARTSGTAVVDVTPAVAVP